MQTEIFDAGSEAEAADFQTEFVPEPTAMDGLAMAIPVSLLLWTVILVLLWMFARKG